MTLFLWNLLLALTWAVALGTFTLGNVAVGFGLGYAILWFARRAGGVPAYFGKIEQVVRFALFYLRQLLLANLRIAYDVVTPRHHMRPGVIGVPLGARTDAEITLLANLITLTPGSVVIDVSDDRSTLFVHVMYLEGDDPDRARRDIKDTLERRVLEVLR